MAPWRIVPEKSGLLIIDVQEKLVPAMFGSSALVKRIVDAAAIARIFGIPIFHTEQVPEKLGPTVAPVREALGPDAAPPQIKWEFSAAGSFGGSGLPPTLLVVGLETHICVRQTVYDLRAHGHAVYVLADAVSSRAEQDHRLALHELREAGARVTTLETVGWELLGGAKDGRFKQVMAVLK